MMNFRAEQKDIYRKYSDQEDLLIKDYENALKELKDNQQKEHVAIYAKCLEVNGKHIDDGGMFYASCVNCGFSDDSFSDY